MMRPPQRAAPGARKNTRKPPPTPLRARDIFPLELAPGLVSEEFLIYPQTLRHLIEMETNDVNEKLIRWNDIFGELILDTNDLVKDLWVNINYIAIFGAAMMFFGAFLAVMEDIQINSFLIFGTWMLFGALQLWRWYSLRSKYNRLRTLQSEMKSI